jgi:hypothetical protein
MSTHGFPDGFVEAAVQAKDAGFRRICLRCWEGFDETDCPKCDATPPAAEGVRGADLRQVEAFLCNARNGNYETTTLLSFKEDCSAALKTIRAAKAALAGGAGGEEPRVVVVPNRHQQRIAGEVAWLRQKITEGQKIETWSLNGLIDAINIALEAPTPGDALAVAVEAERKMPVGTYCDACYERLDRLNEAAQAYRAKYREGGRSEVV